MKALQFSVTVPQFAALKVLGSISRRFYNQAPLATIWLVDIPEPTLPSTDWVKMGFDRAVSWRYKKETR